MLTIMIQHFCHLNRLHQVELSTMRQSDVMSPDLGVQASTGTMKRKRSEELVERQSAKRQADTSTTSIAHSNPLCEMLREYSMLEAVVSCLCADDLLALALASKALYEAIMPRPVSLENLLGRLKCSGKGIGIRSRCHQKSESFHDFECTEWAICGSDTSSRVVETKPCVTCKVATCDECRVHCVYQSIFQAPDDPDDTTELPNFSGFVLLEPHEHGILSPHHLDLNEPSPRWQDPTKALSAPYHDQGYLDAPLQYDGPVPVECVGGVLDFDLGQQSLNSMTQDSGYEYPPPVLNSLCEVTESRIIIVCDACLLNSAPQGPDTIKTECNPMPKLPWLSQRDGTSPITPCQCTLRKRFLDRWLCLRCYEDEEKTIKASKGPPTLDALGICRCGKPACHILCLWCWGEVVEEEDDDFYETIDNAENPAQ
jgi:hypothetical protein